MFLNFHNVFSMMSEAYPPSPAPPAAPTVETPPPAAAPTVCNHEKCNSISANKLKDLQDKFKLLSRDAQRMYLCQYVHYKKAAPAAPPPRKRSRLPKTKRTNKER